MTDAPLFSVIIPLFNKWEMTGDCLRSLREHAPEQAFEVIAADNGSTDATAGELEALGRALFGRRFTRLRFEENRNFGPACNAAARIAASGILFFLNNDTLLRPGWAPPLLEALAAEAGPAAVGPLLLYGNGTVQHLGVTFGIHSVSHLHQGFPADHPAVHKKRELQAITAAALMLPRTVFFRHGAFSEEYRNGFEDLELCLRIRAAGGRMLCIPESEIIHLEGQSPGRREHDSRNAELFAGRCANLRTPDEHLHALADGFVPFIDDSFEIKLRLPTEDAEALMREAEHSAPETLAELVRRNPYWAEGRLKLAEQAAARGDAAAQLAPLAEAAFLLGSAEAHARLARAAAKAGEDTLAGMAAQKSAELAARRRDARYARTIMNRLAANADASLRVMMEKALAERA